MTPSRDLDTPVHVILVSKISGRLFKGSATRKQSFLRLSTSMQRLTGIDLLHEGVLHVRTTLFEGQEGTQ